VKRWCAVLLALVVGTQLAASPAEERGDRAWKGRHAGFAESGRVSPGPATEAVAAYEQALLGEPRNVPLRLKLVEALYFQGSFATDDDKTGKKIYDRAVELAEETVDLVAASVGDPREIRKLPLEQRAERIRAASHAAPAHFWAAIAWGLWGMSHNRAAAGFKGVAGKIRDHARMVMLLDPGYAAAGGMRLLGRLHTATPRIVLFTGWIDRREGLELLRRASEISTDDARNPLFLAEAILKYDPERRPDALRMLREVSARRPDPDYLVEQSEIIGQARVLLGELGLSSTGESP